jgi:hypothetical protein
MKRNKRQRDFDRSFRQTETMIRVIFVFTFLTIIIMFVGGAFVVYKLMAFFGIL